jgi:hypothetical protein
MGVFGGKSLVIFCLFRGSGSFDGKRNRSLEGQLPLIISLGRGGNWVGVAVLRKDK